jgi:hypothetical protein
VKLSFLSDVYAAGGPYATAYLDVRRDHENAAREIELRWQAERAALSDAGADEATLAAMEAALADPPPVPSAGGRCLVGTGGTVVLDRPTADPPRRPGARFGALPDLMQYLTLLPRTVPYVVAVVDRIGADLYAFRPDETGLPEAVRDDQVTGADRPVTKVAAGGWSARRWQQRAENLWHSNAGLVAEQVDRLVGEVGARCVIAAGDVRARAALRAALPQRSAALLVETDAGGRAVGDSDDSLGEAVAAELDARYRAEIAGAVDSYRGSPHAADGLDATIDALRGRRVDTLLLRDDTETEADVYVGPRPEDLARNAAELADLRVDDPVAERADAALLRAAVAGDAELVVLAADRGEPSLAEHDHREVPDLDLSDGVGFIGRY